MARGSTSCRHRGRHGRLTPSRAQLDAEQLASIFQAHTPHDIHAEIELGEANDRVHKHFIEDDVVDAYICLWVPNTSFTYKGN
jgi:hypothetical protein